MRRAFLEASSLRRRRWARASCETCVSKHGMFRMVNINFLEVILGASRKWIYFTISVIHVCPNTRGFCLSQGFPSGFPLVFDVNLDQAGANERLQYMADGLFLDNATDTLTVALLTFNGKSAIAPLLSVCCVISRNILVNGLEAFSDPQTVWNAC